MQSDAGERTVYARLAGLAYKNWVHWQEAWGEELILPTGRLALGPDAMRSVALERKQYMEKAGITDVELLEIEELQYRWPQLNYEGFGIGLFNSGGAGGSTIRAREACQCVARAFVNNAGKLQTGHARPGKTNGSRLEEVVLSNAEPISAQHFVFACGPWLPKLFPELLGKRLQVQRRDVFFFGTPPGDSRFSFPNLPEWSFQGTGYYGFPVIDGRGLKVAPYPDYNALDPDTDERIVNPYSAKRAHDFVNERFPALRGQPITESRVCQVTNSIDSHFIVDTHPDYNNVWIVGGGSGHGFKHGPGLGEYIARRVLEGEGDPEFDEVFRLQEEMF